MVQVLQSAFTEALGWSLLDSLWQTGALWGLYCMITANGRNYTSTIRHNLAYGSLALSTILFFATLFINYERVIQDNHPFSLSYLIYQPLEKSWDFPIYPDVLISILSSAYLAMTLFNCFKLLFQYSSGYSLKKDLHPVSEAIANQVFRLSKKVKTGKKISIWLSEKIATPITIGVLKPVILLPVSLVTQLNSLQLEAIIVHELHHVRRNDYLLNLVLVFTEAIMFFNPFALLLSSLVRNERENSCDDKVLQLGYDAWSYSQALYTISSHNNRIPGKLILAAAGSRKKLLLDRIKRMMNLSRCSPSLIKPAAAFFLCLTVAFFAVRGTPEKSTEVPVPKEEKNATTSLLLYRPQPVVIEKKEGVVEMTEEKTDLVEKKSSNGAEQRDVHPYDNLFVDEYFAVPLFITDEKELEFTIIIPEVPEIPQPAARETPMPYVPGSTFYFPSDSLNIEVPGGEVIRI